MAIDTAGTIYIADANDRVRDAVDSKGIITTFADLSSNAFPARSGFITSQWQPMAGF